MLLELQTTVNGFFLMKDSFGRGSKQGNYPKNPIGKEKRTKAAFFFWVNYGTSKVVFLNYGLLKVGEVDFQEHSEAPSLEEFLGA